MFLRREAYSGILIMAHLYQQKRSPFWWVKFRDPKTGLTCRKSTGQRIGEGSQTKKARQQCAELTLAENADGAATIGGSARERWDAWVRDFLVVRYGERCRFDIAWDTINLFLVERKIPTPRQLTRAHCLEYMAWRRKPDVRAGKYKAGLNTSILEVKVIGLVMKEAVIRGYAQFNPCRELGIKREKHREKPEYTDEDFAFIEAAIAKESEPLRTFYAHSFAIARYQGCRLSETHLNPQDAVQLRGDSGTISFLAKGNKVHVAPLHPRLIPMFRQLIDSGATETYEQPKSPARMWFAFLTRCGMKKLKPGACFHSLRVTAATRLARSRIISEAKAMKFIGHASTTVHRSYQRLRPDDLSDCLDALG